jgi:hypothetical protein
MLLKGELKDRVAKVFFLVPKRVPRLYLQLLIPLPPCSIKGDWWTAFRKEEWWAIEDLNL